MGVGAVLGGEALAMEPIARSHDTRLKVSCCAYSLRKYLQGEEKNMELTDFIARAVDWGLDGVELTSYYFAEKTAEYARALRRQCFLSGIDVSGTALGNKFAVPPGPEREKQIADVRQWIDLAEAMGAPCMRVFGGPVPKDMPVDEAIGWAVDGLNEAAEYAATKGVYLALENHGGVTDTPANMLRILKGVESDWVGANLDTGNFHGEDVYGDVAELAPYAVNVHLKAHVKPAGKPAEPTDFSRVTEILREAKYSGYISLEYEASEDPMTAVPRLIDQMRAAIA